jgi:hypothetical protein
MAGPFTTPVAKSVPFESEPERSNGFSSKDVQEAIEEALALAVSNDRYLIFCQYNGNAGNGRFLEFFEGIDSSVAPVFFNAGTNVLEITVATTAVSSSGRFQFYDVINDPGFTTPLYTLNMQGNKRKTDIGTVSIPLFTIPANGALAIVKQGGGSVQKPHMQLILSSSI